ncbi:hypothetical protein TrispH2_009291 [Trichoplax sp. H2]|nr:hypothetical protein TrispH2_009291 [Trichoplax sp. H2]|eukprot:RDD37495.1 hypothetical protein TrispH2_009291 [Trichoplax sp. H2]
MSRSSSSTRNNKGNSKVGENVGITNTAHKMTSSRTQSHVTSSSGLSQEMKSDQQANAAYLRKNWQEIEEMVNKMDSGKHDTKLEIYVQKPQNNREQQEMANMELFDIDSWLDQRRVRSI